MRNRLLRKLLAELRIMDHFIHDFDQRFFINDGVVTRIDLDNVDLASFPYFPRSLLNFTDLEHLSLKNTNLNAFPKEVLHFENLKSLELSKNLLEDVPKEIEQFTELSHLHISQNRIARIQRLPESIEVLNLSDNNLTEMTDLFQHYDKLRVVNLARNHIQEISKYLPSSLEMLNLRSNHIRLVPNEIMQLPRLKKLNLYDNPIGNLNSLPKNSSLTVFLDNRTTVTDKNNVIVLQPVLHDVRDSQKHPPLFQLTSVMMFGAEFVGKKTILKNYINNFYYPSKSLVVTQNKYLAWEHYILDHNNQWFQVWYPQSQDNDNDYYIQGILSGFYYTSMVALVFDLTNLETFRLVLNAIGRIHDIRQQSCPVIVVGNKSDKLNRFGDKKSIVEKLDILARNFNISINYIEVSGKTGYNVKSLFELIYSQQI